VSALCAPTCCGPLTVYPLILAAVPDAWTVSQQFVPKASVPLRSNVTLTTAFAPNCAVRRGRLASCCR
jgi:hypothetical protein